MKDAYPSKVIFVRHAESEGNLLTVEERAKYEVGTNRYALTERGKLQAKFAGEWLQEYFPRPDRIIRSYYQRVHETSDICYPDLPKRQESLLAEANRGIWHVATEEEIRAALPFEVRRRDLEGYYHYRAPGGENWPDVERRVREFRRSIRKNYEGKVIVVFGHGTWHLVWQKVLGGWDDTEVMERYQTNQIVHNASISVYNGRFDLDTGRPYLLHNPSQDYVVPWKGRIL